MDAAGRPPPHAFRQISPLTPATHAAPLLTFPDPHHPTRRSFDGRSLLDRIPAEIGEEGPAGWSGTPAPPPRPAGEGGGEGGGLGPREAAAVDSLMSYERYRDVVRGFRAGIPEAAQLLQARRARAPRLRGAC